jgi:Ca2+-binding EF-hand superfamily protein
LIREVGVLRGGVITFHEFVAATIPRTQYFEATNVTTVFNGLDADGDGIVSLRDLEALLGTNDDYAKAIMYDCGMEPDTGLQFADFFQIYCGSEYNYY